MEVGPHSGGRHACNDVEFEVDFEATEPEHIRVQVHWDV